jgi:hypothetical protein
MSGQFKQRLFEALHALVGAGELDKRLTFAGAALAPLQEADVPKKHRQAFMALKSALVRTPLSWDLAHTPQQLSQDDMVTAARQILELYTDAMGGL